ncbi:MAG: hypothetical protein C4K47_05220 [Candidatus Thorarchaeota archaeon]|nr:MAG: hypothetical protein C4K47_05220 [Candidatus Thorarchaeota archaeon]
MDHHHQRTIVPVAAISTVEMVTGPPVQKPIPEDYVLADFVLRAIDSKEGRDLEFVLKAYLDFLVMPTGSPGKCFFVEMRGLTSASVPVLQEYDLDELIRKVHHSETQSQLVAAIKETGVYARGITGVEEILLRGVVSNPTASSLAQLLAWPMKEQAETYSMLFPSTIDTSYCTSVRNTLRNLSEFTHKAETGLPWLVDALRMKARDIMAALEGDLSPKLSRLDLRISALRREISGIESKTKQIPRSERHGPKEAETRDLLRARQTALDRDLKRRDKTVSESETLKSELSETLNAVLSELEVSHEMILAFRKSIDSIEATVGSLDVPEDGIRLLVPVIIAGLSKKGRLDMVVYPPSILIPGTQKAGRRKDFTDSLISASEELAQIAAWCEEQISNDVTLKKSIRDSSEVRNLLALKNTRAAIGEGVKLLLADGFANEPAVNQIETLLSGVPEHSLTLDATPPAGTELIPGKASDCTLILHVRDENDTPVNHPVLETADIKAEGNQQGVIRVRLWAGLHRASISGAGHRSKSIEFSLQSGTDVVIPVALSPLSREEEIEKELDQLVGRAERIDQVRKRLADAFGAQGETMLSIPAYRSSLVELLVDLGYDPESWISEAKKKKGMVKRFLKRDDRADALRRDILRIAEESKRSGGIMLFSGLLVQLDAKGWTTDMNEVTSIIGGLSRDGLIEGLATIEGGARLVKFVPVGLTDDPQKVLSLAAEKDGHLTPEDVVLSLGWTEERVRNALNLLVANGVAKVQKSYSQSTQYWFPGLRMRPAREQESQKDETT